MTGLTVFAMMSLVCGLAPSTGVLVLARGAQGVGAALTVPAAVSIIAITFAEGPERNRALGIFGASGSAGFGVGLVVGGALTATLGWRWIFLVKVPFVLAAGAVAAHVVASGEPAARGRGYDVRGALLAASGLLLLVLLITQLAARTLPIAALAAVGVGSLACLTAFVVNERTGRGPLVAIRESSVAGHCDTPTSRR